MTVNARTLVKRTGDQLVRLRQKCLGASEEGEVLEDSLGSYAEVWQKSRGIRMVITLHRRS